MSKTTAVNTTTFTAWAFVFAGGIMASLQFGPICVLFILSALTHTAASQQLNTVYRVSPFFVAEKRGIFELASYAKGFTINTNNMLNLFPLLLVCRYTSVYSRILKSVA